jgi:site-specific DNA-methyltransferase (adenine-specific)
MKPKIVVDGARVFLGDCRDVLKSLPDNSVDSIVTDPPYELGFMGKKWDSSGIAYDVDVWSECLRVLKPGGHVLAFGGSRTWHRLAVAIEDAGFQLRDSIAWLYSTGFPKSLDVSKAIDKSNGETGRKFKFTKWMRTTGLTARKIDEITGTNMGGHYLTDKSQPAIPTAELWAVLRPHCGDVPGWVDELVARIEAEREVIGQHEAPAKSIYSQGENELSKDVALTAPATPEAQKWQGWGTALKPAFEPVVVGRKPIQGTVANNVLEWGVGGLNIDGSRIKAQDAPEGRSRHGGGIAGNGTSYELPDSVSKMPAGRWPANVILDEVTAGLLDEQSGVSKPKPGRTGRKGGNNGALGEFAGSSPDAIGVWPEDLGGGASRFFYVAKASKRDRNEGLEELEARRNGKMMRRANNTSDEPSAGFERFDTEPAKNFHPTVKPTQLMRYLIKLVTPAGGTVLDPFTGSGSTGKAALLDGFEFIGAELTGEYLPIIEGRLKWAVENRESV